MVKYYKVLLTHRSPESLLAAIQSPAASPIVDCKSSQKTWCLLSIYLGLVTVQVLRFYVKKIIMQYMYFVIWWGSYSYNLLLRQFCALCELPLTILPEDFLHNSFLHQIGNSEAKIPMLLPLYDIKVIQVKIDAFFTPQAPYVSRSHGVGVYPCFSLEKPSPSVPVQGCSPSKRVVNEHGPDFDQEIWVRRGVSECHAQLGWQTGPNGMHVDPRSR